MYMIEHCVQLRTYMYIVQTENLANLLSAFIYTLTHSTSDNGHHSSTRVKKNSMLKI